MPTFKDSQWRCSADLGSVTPSARFVTRRRSREANNDHEQAATAPGSLVGRRAIAWYEWPESGPPRAEWLRATVVKYRPRVRSELEYLLHYDVDGEDFAWDGEGDDE